MKRFALLLLLACGPTSQQPSAAGGGSGLPFEFKLPEPDAGAPGLKEGDSCVGDFACNSDRSALFCEPRCDGGSSCAPRLTQYPCPGPIGCTRNQSGTTNYCDVTDTPAGSACPEFFTGLGFCATDGGVRVCSASDAGRVWLNRACSNCRTQGDNIVCG